MKKILTFLILCLLGTIAFAETRQAEPQQLTAAVNSHQESVENFEIKINEVGLPLISCTWTHTVYWYNEYGYFLGTTSATVTMDTGTAFDCAGARYLAQQQAEAMY